MTTDQSTQSELWRLSAVECANGIRTKCFTSSELIESVLDRVQQYDPKINSIVVDLADQAREEATNKDRELQNGSPIGPLHGIPVTIKTNIDQAGTATSNGLPALANTLVDEDAPLVRNFRRAGAIIIGRTNTPELSMRATTVNPLYGRTHNPWDEEASAGGSSGGAGAAAASGFGPIHHGNDIGGSLRFPSFANGVCTVKPTLGRVPAYNPSAPGERGLLAQLISVQGVICREVRDVRLALGVIARGDPQDPWWVPAPLYDWPDTPPKRVALTRETHGYPIHPGIVDSLDRAATHLEEAGYAVEEVTTPSIARAAKAWHDVLVAELRDTIGSLADEHGSEDLKKIFQYYYALGDLVDSDGYLSGVAERTAMTREWNVFLDEFPLVLSPFMMRPTFPHDYDVRGFEQTRDIFEASIFSTGVNYLSLPAGVMPISLVEGLPSGIQLIGRRYREDLILDAMQAIEDRNGIFAHRLWEKMETGKS